MPKAASTTPKTPKTPKTPAAKRAAKSKQVSVVAVVSADGEIQGTFTPEPRRPLIAHLPFRSSDIQFNDGPLVYDPRPPVNPEPYDAFADDLYASNAELLNTDASTEQPEALGLPPSVSESTLATPAVTQSVANVATAADDKPVKAFRTMDVMIEYRVANETQTLPESTCAACFWCAGSFEGRPIVMPTQEEGGIYTVYGNFCTLSCGLSYLLNEQVDPQVRWERQALLHRMYKQPVAVHPAPPRESLRLFGGPLSHEQYREVIEKKQIRVDAHLPPVISILATLDTKPIDFYETSLRNTSTNGTGVDVVKPVESGLRLKRSKPLKDKESTLDAVMNLQVRVKN
jgi:hypothetical protein